MALDFPNSPTTGQSFTGAGVIWKWDGGKWVSASSDAWSSFPDAPADGFGYGRKDLAWAKVLLLTGGTVTGNVTMTNAYVTNTLLINPANSWEWYFQRDASGNHIQNHRANWWDQWNNSDGTRQWNSPSGTLMSLDGTGNMVAKGRVEALTYLRASGDDGSGWGLSVSASAWVGGNVQTGDVHASNAWIAATVQGNYVHAMTDMNAEAYVRSYNGRVIAQGTSNPGHCNHWPGVFANGMICDSNGALLFGQMDGNGSWVATWASINTAKDFWVAGAVTCAYLHSTGSLQVDGSTVTNGNITGGRIRATNGVMSSNGVFYVADNDAYYIGRNGGNGDWNIVENGTVQHTIQANGDSQLRGTSYQNNAFNRGQVWVANDWNTQFGAGGSGRILQFTSNYFFDYNAGNGNMAWVGAGGGLMAQRTPDWLAWNQTGPVGGIGGYQNYSDSRGKTDIEPTTVGLTEIMKMKPARFTRTIKPELSIGRFFPDGRPVPDFIPRSEIGFIAQELQEALPEAVVEVADFVDGEARLMMTLDPIVAALVNAVKELTARLTVVESGA